MVGVIDSKAENGQNGIRIKIPAGIFQESSNTASGLRQSF